jgi:hypothetical protein
MAPPAGGEASADGMPPIETPPPRIGAPGALPAEADALGDLPQQQSPRAVIAPPLPRPRPATLAAAKPSQEPQVATPGVSNAKPGPVQPDVASTAPVAPPKSAPPQSPSAKPSDKPGKASNFPAIND